MATVTSASVVYGKLLASTRIELVDGFFSGCGRSSQYFYTRVIEFLDGTHSHAITYHHIDFMISQRRHRMACAVVMATAGIIDASEGFLCSIIEDKERGAAKMAVHGTLAAFINLDRNAQFHDNVLRQAPLPLPKRPMPQPPLSWAER
jgi:hypothetical protein